MELIGIIFGLVVGSLWSLLILAFINSVEKKVDKARSEISHLESRFDAQIDAFYNILDELTGGENDG